MTITVNIHEAKTQMSRLARAVEAGETVIVARAGTPIMEWRSVRPRAPLFGSIPGFGGPGWEEAFTEEADAEVRAMFDEDLGLDDPA
ncbi:type II toxin-antitoxin system Phd/YefM family antitoxin [Aeromicrobium piscarium]|uniref:Type II toxin-antitoxin system prevent-host-death family antitoxin n=1 Tax=Aeromicrobium piscarium TaxID=2590901 RepID=A0A554SQ38_9ACTN|nr:type II toxin-antitoxin system prevent-host-death family antitoxin [Aeromicrobium piscarium]TSD68464.1 type II toxin-antitoxin system prevent-host-death family antitoxin [Aeromicrobium piscarium]